MSSVRFVAPRGTEQMLQTVVIVVHLLVALGVVVLVLLQHGKGADAGAHSGRGHRQRCSVVKVVLPF